jgi:hypothetical protein
MPDGICGKSAAPYVLIPRPLFNQGKMESAAKVPRFIVLSSLSAFQPKRRGRFAAILLENREG